MKFTNATQYYIDFVALNINSELATLSQHSSVTNLKLVAKHDELNIINDTFKNSQLLPKKYLYKTFQYFIVHNITGKLKYFWFDKQVKIENLPQWIKYYNIFDLVYLFNETYRVSLCVDRVIEEIAKYIEFSFKHQRRNKPTKLIAKNQELLFDSIHLAHGLVSAKIFYLTLQHLIEHRLNFENPIRIQKSKFNIIQNLPTTLLCYELSKALSALNNYMQEYKFAA